MRYVPFRYAPALKIQFPPKVGEHKISESKFGLAENQRLEKQKKYRRDSRRYSGQFDFVLEAAD